MLQNAWFLFCETQPENWSEDHIYVRFKECALYFCNCLRQRDLPQYFNRNRNLLDNKPADQLDVIADNIMEFLIMRGFCGKIACLIYNHDFLPTFKCHIKILK